MKLHRSFSLTAALLCLAVSVSAWWLWRTYSDTKFEARVRLTWAMDPFGAADRPEGGNRLQDGIEELVLSPDVLSTAAELLHDRGIPLSLASPFDSEIDYLLERLHCLHPDDDGADDIQITCLAADADEACAILTAVVDALLSNLKAHRPAGGVSALEELEKERRQLAHAIKRQENKVADLVEQNRAAGETGEAGQVVEALQGQIAEARRTLTEAERRLDAAQIEFERKMPANVVAASLAEGPLRTQILERLNLVRLRNELRHEQEQLEKWSSVYGRNHPRMAEIRENIDQLRTQTAHVPIESGDGKQPSVGASPILIVLDALEADVACAQSNHQDLASRLAAANELRQAGRDSETELVEARQEMMFLKGENKRVLQQLEGAQRQEARQLPAVVEQPALSVDPVSPNASLQIAVACASGMALYLLFLWQIRPRDHKREGEAGRAARPTAPRRNRFLSQEEQQLVRLKMLSAAR